VAEIRSRIIAEISGYFKCTNIYPEYTLLTRMDAGSDTELHADSEKNENGIWVPNHTPVRSHTGMLYLNTCNEDYTGGEIVFPEVGEKISPQAGMLVGFKTTHEYVHQVLPILKGHRFALSFWMTQNEAHKELWG
jgi:predicted 2-oxoglutarate/Fe(II)-dependent dioxygenase YbiX